MSGLLSLNELGANMRAMNIAGALIGIGLLLFLLPFLLKAQFADGSIRLSETRGVQLVVQSPIVLLILVCGVIGLVSALRGSCRAATVA